jgi:hypothetical protein
VKQGEQLERKYGYRLMDQEDSGFDVLGETESSFDEFRVSEWDGLHLLWYGVVRKWWIWCSDTLFNSKDPVAKFNALITDNDIKSPNCRIPKDPIKTHKNFIAMEFRDLFQVLHIVLRRFVLLRRLDSDASFAGTFYRNLMQLMLILRAATKVRISDEFISDLQKRCNAFVHSFNVLNPPESRLTHRQQPFDLTDNPRFSERVQNDCPSHIELETCLRCLFKWNASQVVFSRGLFLDADKVVFDYDYDDNGSIIVRKFDFGIE